ncbi:hypothetical protein Ga0466249_000378 [Sporomusaceae bacterium BoRhaA]|uniref:hypothetical protein n=1 Tax=Pelorhabdus rhamnosifermentans TaxID=2772457 RepID=UPI001C06260D|nr:hypothetical protein [Pelorhabdus rhamnosifermentans]MBU2699299.1 hypothetical protein [Pelorhabdus rhamnosifermentans]
MMIDKQIEILLKDFKVQLNKLEFGNVDFVIQNNTVIRLDIKSSVKPEKSMFVDNDQN